MHTFTKLIEVVAVVGLTSCGAAGPDVPSKYFGESYSSSDLPSTTIAVDLLAGVQTFTELANGHVTLADVPLHYDENPSIGGEHLDVWQNCGFYGKAILDEAGVHSMEHGAVWITYNPELSVDQVQLLDTTATRHSYVLISPRDGLPSAIVASAWGKQLALESADDPAMMAFVEMYANGPQTPEPGAPCTGGNDLIAEDLLAAP